MNNIIVKFGGGYHPVYRKEASVRFVSERLPKGGQRHRLHREEVSSHGC